MTQGNAKASSIFIGAPSEPITIPDLSIAGFAVEPAKAGQPVKVCVRMSLTSDDVFFHAAADNLAGVIAHATGNGRTIYNANSVLLVLHGDNTADLWIDSAFVATEIMARREITPGSLVFDRDIADIRAISFPHVQLSATDGVIYLFREGWRFGLFCDFNDQKQLDISGMQRDLGKLYRRLKYRDLYDVVADSAVFDQLLKNGWFPFVEIIGPEFKKLSLHCTPALRIEDAENELLGAFDYERIERIFARWLTRPHFASRQKILRSAIDAFKAGDSVSVLKNLLTEIEGILQDAYKNAHGNPTKLDKLLEFAIKSGEQKAGSSDTLFMPTEFFRYLKNHTFAHFDPRTSAGNIASRHAAGHGAAGEDAYTQVRALQAILTVDQLAFYT